MGLILGNQAIELKCDCQCSRGIEGLVLRDLCTGTAATVAIQNPMRGRGTASMLWG